MGDVVRSYAERDWLQTRLGELTQMLEHYAAVLEPWARAIATRMLAEVSRRDERAWFDRAAWMGREIRDEIRSAPTGATAQQLLAAQVDLITSLPREAAARVQKIALENVHTGARAESMVDEIMRTGDVTRSRAELIARTETSRAQTAFTQARAMHLGATHYIWRTARDANVRPSHRALEGKTFAWTDPPVCEPTGEHAHPGSIWNCRCWAEPVFDD